MRPQDILTPMPEGLFCKPGGFYIDPVRPVDRAIITHGHSDHARAGHGRVLATPETLDMCGCATGRISRAPTQAMNYGDKVTLRTEVRLPPAGHVLGSAQISVVRKRRPRGGLRRLQGAPDPTCPPFEPVPCDVFITEATFGLPVFAWRAGAGNDQAAESVAPFPERAHLVGAYSLGKAQRVIAMLRGAGYDKPIYPHGAMEKITHYYERAVSRSATGARTAV